MTALSHQPIRFAAGAVARAVRAAQGTPGQALVEALALPPPRALLVLNGGTAELAPRLAARLRDVLQLGLARVVAEERITVITGGSDGGVFGLFGAGLDRWPPRAPCIGVAVERLVAWPGHAGGEAMLEPHHSHFVLVEGAAWGDETATMYALVAALARECPSVAVFAGGGEIVKQEMLANMRQQRPMILLGGSGRITDTVLDPPAAELLSDPDLQAIVAAGLITRFDLTAGPDALRALLRQTLGLSR